MRFIFASLPKVFTSISFYKNYHYIVKLCYLDKTGKLRAIKVYFTADAAANFNICTIGIVLASNSYNFKGLSLKS